MVACNIINVEPKGGGKNEESQVFIVVFAIYFYRDSSHGCSQSGWHIGLRTRW